MVRAPDYILTETQRPGSNPGSTIYWHGVLGKLFFHFLESWLPQLWNQRVKNRSWHRIHLAQWIWKCLLEMLKIIIMMTTDEKKCMQFAFFPDSWSQKKVRIWRWTNITWANVLRYSKEMKQNLWSFLSSLNRKQNELDSDSVGLLQFMQPLKQDSLMIQSMGLESSDLDSNPISANWVDLLKQWLTLFVPHVF